MNGMTLNWKGDQITGITQRACATGINRVMGDCVSHSKSIVHRRTSILQGSLNIVKYAEKKGNGITGMWGSQAVKYAMFVEEGTGPHFPPVKALAMSMKITMDEAWPIAFAISKHGTRAYPYLRPAMDANYPKLGDYCRQAFDGGHA